MIDNPNLYHYFLYIEATPRFELGIKDLQSSALPLGHIAFFIKKFSKNYLIFFLIISLFFLLIKNKQYYSINNS